MDSQQIEQRSDEWLEARLGKATASRFADIMATTRSGYGAGRKNYLAELVIERLTGEKANNFSSTAMDWGTDTEATARLTYSLITGNDVEETGFWEHDTLQAGASPDGLIGADGLVEIKCPNTATHLETLRQKQVPKKYYWQVMGQMWITGRKWCDFVSYDPRLPENAQIIIVRLERDEDAIKDLEGQVTTFLREVASEVKFITEYQT